MNLQLVYRYIFSKSKNESMFYEKYKKKKQKQNKTKGPKKKKKKVLSKISIEPRISDKVTRRITYCATKASTEGRCKRGALGFSVLRFWLFFQIGFSAFVAKDLGCSVLVVIAVCGFFVF